MAAEWILPAGLVTARAIHFAACMGLAGFWVFDSILPPETDRALWRPTRRAASNLLLALVLLSGITWFLLVARDMGGDWSAATLRTVCTETLFGKVQSLRLAFFLAALFLIKKERGAFSVIACAALLASLAWAGHGGTGPHRPWHLTADVIHLLAAGCWPGALLPLAFFLRRQSASLNLLRRFSGMSMAAVFLMMGTGLVNALCLVNSLAGLTETPYGIALLVKSGIFFIMIGVGIFNFFRMGSQNEGTRLASNVRIELFLAGGIVLLVGLMGILPPALSHS